MSRGKLGELLDHKAGLARHPPGACRGQSFLSHNMFSAVASLSWSVFVDPSGHVPSISHRQPLAAKPGL